MVYCDVGAYFCLILCVQLTENTESLNGGSLVTLESRLTLIIQMYGKIVMFIIS